MRRIRRILVGLILNALALVLWSIVGIGTAVTSPSWTCLVFGGLMTIYLANTVIYIRNLIRFLKVKRAAQNN